MHYVIPDFGFAKHMFQGDRFHALRGSPLYMAPEIICKGQYDARVDLWSIGVILYGEYSILVVVNFYFRCMATSSKLVIQTGVILGLNNILFKYDMLYTFIVQVG